MEKQIRLVQALLERSRQNGLEWQQTAEDDEFVVSFKSNSVRIAKIENSRSGGIYKIDIVNDQGQAIESFSNRDIEEFAMLEWDPVDSLNNMKEIFAFAKRKAFGTEKALGEILAELERG